MPPPGHEDALERLVSRACREQPPLKAPAGLSRAILAEIERREALPWWRRSFALWPAAMQVLFIILCAGIAWFSLTASPGGALAQATGGADGLPAGKWLHDAAVSVSFVNSLLDHLGVAVLRSVPPLWLYSALLGVCALYALLAGLYVTAYRTLYAPIRAAH
ncbi:MAG: hypothetical protein NVS2B1_18970 [Bradyrhizobium sp.]